MNNRTLAGLFIGATLTTIATIGVGVRHVQSHLYTDENAQEFLEGEGYEVIDGGDSKLFSNCLRKYPRTYSVEKGGVTSEKTVCMGASENTFEP